MKTPVFTIYIVLLVVVAVTGALPAKPPGKPQPVRVEARPRNLKFFRPSATKVLLYPANIVSYARIGMLPYAAHAAQSGDWKRFATAYSALLAGARCQWLPAAD